MNCYELEEWIRRDMKSLLFTHLKNNGIVCPEELMQQEHIQNMMNSYMSEFIHKIETDYQLSIYLQVEKMYNSIIGA